MMAKNACFSFSSCSITILVWFHFLTFALAADYYDEQLLGVNATWPSGAKMVEQDCCDGNLTDPTSLDPFRDGPPTVYLKVNHDPVFNKSYIQATNKTLLSSKYLVMATIYNETRYEDTDYNYLDFLWIQGNMTASTPGGIISNDNTFATLSNDTEPLYPYSVDFNLSEVVSNLRFDQTTWRLSIGVYQQTPEFDNFLYTSLQTIGNAEQNKTLLFRMIFFMLENTYWGEEDPSILWNATSISPWGRVYADVPGIFTSSVTATPTPSSSSTTGGNSGASSTSSSQPTATPANAGTKHTVYGDSSAGIVFLYVLMISALSISLFL